MTRGEAKKKKCEQEREPHEIARTQIRNDIQKTKDRLAKFERDNDPTMWGPRQFAYVAAIKPYIVECAKDIVQLNRAILETYPDDILEDERCVEWERIIDFNLELAGLVGAIDT
jgi:hypothetical protein